MTKLGLGIAAVLALFSGACSDDDVPPAFSGAAGDAPGTGGAGGSAGSPSCDGTESTDATFSQALQVLRTELERQGVPGGAIAVIKDGKLWNAGVAGSKRATVCDPITLDTLFGTLFATEIITTIAALDAVEDNKLLLNDPIKKVVHELEVDKGKVELITLHHLLTQTSMYAAEPFCGTLADAFASATNPVLQAEPGTMQAWNPSNFDLTGLALQKVDDKPFVEAVTERVLAPLGMGGAFDTASVLASGDYSLGHYGDPILEEEVDADCRNQDPSQNYRGSIRDMAKLAEFLTGDGGQVLEQATLDLMLSEQAPNWESDSYTTYGLNGSPWSDYGTLWMYSNGWGFTQVIYVFRRLRMAVVTLMNSRDGNPWRVNDAVAPIIDRTIQFPIVECMPTLADLSGLEGTYVGDVALDGKSQRTLEITLESEESGVLSGELTVDGSKTRHSFVVYGDCTSNFYVDGKYGARFWRDASGSATAVSFAADNGPPLFRVL